MNELRTFLPEEIEGEMRRDLPAALRAIADAIVAGDFAGWYVGRALSGFAAGPAVDLRLTFALRCELIAESPVGLAGGAAQRRLGA